MRAIGQIIGGVLFGGLFVAIGALAGWWVGVDVTLACNRIEPPGQCVLTSSRLFSPESRITFGLDELQEARVAVSTSSDSDDTYRVELITERGILPFTDFYSSGDDGKRATVARINRFIASAQERQLQVSESNRLFAYLFGGLFMLGGSVAIMAGLLSGLRRLARGF